MATSALLHFEGDAAVLVRWIAGPHVGENRDIPALLTFLAGKIDQSLFNDLEGILVAGIPTQSNFQLPGILGIWKSQINRQRPGKDLQELPKTRKVIALHLMNAYYPSFSTVI
jgi:hypothetical protein